MEVSKVRCKSKNKQHLKYVTVPKNSDIEVGDYVKLIKIKTETETRSNEPVSVEHYTQND